MCKFELIPETDKSEQRSSNTSMASKDVVAYRLRVSFESCLTSGLSLCTSLIDQFRPLLIDYEWKFAVCGSEIRVLKCLALVLCSVRNSYSICLEENGKLCRSSR